MKQNVFTDEMRKIAQVFGGQHYPHERLRLIWAEVNDLTDEQFKKIVEHFVGDRNVNYPPARKDFIEEAHRIRASQKERESRQLAKVIEIPKSDGSGLRKILEDTGASSLKEAIFKQRFSNRSS